MSRLLNKRRSCNSLLTVFCLIYTAYISLKILNQISSPNVCAVPQDIDEQILSRELTPESKIQEEEETFGSVKYVFSHLDRDLEVFKESDVLDNDEDGRYKIAKEEEKYLATLEDTIYFGCSDLDIIPRTRKKVEENIKGNRGISFLRIRVDGVTQSVVLKEANRHLQTPSEEYKFNSAKKEILYLRKLRGLRGIPKLYGSCIEDYRIRYLVERVEGTTICNDNGTTPFCATGEYMETIVNADPHPEFAALSVAYSTVYLMKQLEDRHLFMEDVSGINFMFSRDWELFMVDADSLVFYNDSRIYSQIYCSVDSQCPEPKGNLWVARSLNVRIYENCDDHKGMCNYKRCRGFGVELHGCGLANWFLCRMKSAFPSGTEVSQKYNEVCTCLHERSPLNRCSFNEAAKMLRQIYGKYYRNKAKEITNKHN